MNNEIQRLHFEIKRINVQLERLRDQFNRLEGTVKGLRVDTERIREAIGGVEAGNMHQKREVPDHQTVPTGVGETLPSSRD